MLLGYSRLSASLDFLSRIAFPAWFKTDFSFRTTHRERYSFDERMSKRYFDLTIQYKSHFFPDFSRNTATLNLVTMTGFGPAAGGRYD